MKSELNGVDVHVIAKELDDLVSSARVDKVYQLGEKELLLKLHKSGVGAFDLIVASDYLCATAYSRSAPEKPSSFAMQLRKVLDGGFVRSVRQRDFDRIVVFEFDVRGVVFYLVAEFFGTGNVFLLDSGRKILGLLEWQKWKDRTLGVGRVYEYPPAVPNPLNMGGEEFMKIKSSGKGVAAAIASSTGLGGFYAEEVCLRAGVDRKKDCVELSEGELLGLFAAFRKILESVGKGLSPVVVYDNGLPVDVIPIPCEKYAGMERKEFGSFNQAVDEYFSLKDREESVSLSKGRSDKRREKLDAILKQQQEALERMKIDAEVEKRKGDAIYTKYVELEEIVGFIKRERAESKSDKEILEQLKGRGVKNLNKFELTLEL